MRNGYVKFFSGIVLFFVSCLVFATTSFQDTKKQARIIWAEHRETLYCHCPFDKHGNILYQHCAYQPKDTRRAKHIEWEHIVPVSWFGRDRPCWREPLCQSKNGKRFKGRNCCEKIDPEFKKMYTDLHNLIPVIGEINKARSYFKFGEFKHEPTPGSSYGTCDLIISDSDKMIEPSKQDKGLIARAVLYMHAQYGVSIASTDKKMYQRWNQAYPPSPWEIRWNEKIKQVQHTDNKYISQYDV